jgi:hypothetical protein
MPVEDFDIHPIGDDHNVPFANHGFVVAMKARDNDSLFPREELKVV